MIFLFPLYFLVVLMCCCVDVWLRTWRSRLWGVEGLEGRTSTKLKLPWESDICHQDYWSDVAQVWGLLIDRNLRPNSTCCAVMNSGKLLSSRASHHHHPPSHHHHPLNIPLSLVIVLSLSFHHSPSNHHPPSHHPPSHPPSHHPSHRLLLVLREKSDVEQSWGPQETQGEAQRHRSGSGAGRFQWNQGRFGRSIVWHANKVFLLPKCYSNFFLFLFFSFSLFSFLLFSFSYFFLSRFPFFLCFFFSLFFCFSFSFSFRFFFMLTPNCNSFPSMFSTFPQE